MLEINKRKVKITSANLPSQIDFLQTRPDQTKIATIIEDGADRMQITNISDAKASLSKLIEKVLKGEEVIIGKAGKPVAKLVPFEIDTSPRQLGAGHQKGRIWMADDFDELPEDVMG